MAEFKLEGELELQIKTMSETMRIYKDEYSIASLMHQNKTIAYTVPVDKDSIAVKKLDDILKAHTGGGTLDIIWPEAIRFDKTQASIKDKELFYHTSILVSTTWNKNDDVFMPREVWAARNTPVHKPTNLEHNSNKIIGHMTGSWAIDTKGSIIDDTTEASLPDKFHILVGSVIYTYWPDNEEYSVQVASLLDSINKGEKYVSMECRFEDFDYALSNSNENKIIARNEDTAFLSKHIRAYGGTGQFKNYKIGRAIKGISFIGKGYVDKPANPESIIFTNDEMFDFAKAEICEKIAFSEKDGVVSNSTEKSKEQSIMTDFYQEQNKQLQEQLKTQAAQLDELKDKFAESHTKELEAKIASLELKASDMDKALKADQEVLSTKTAEADELQKKIAELSAANDELAKSNKEFTDKLATIEAEQKVQARVSTLIAGGLTQEDAVKEVNTFATLNDEQFAAIAERIVQAAKFGKDMKKEECKEDEKVDVKAEDVEAAEVTSEEVVSASVIVPETDPVFESLVKNLSASLKISDQENGDK